MKHLETLKAYQAWRRDKTTKSMDELGLTPKNIGEALDWAIAELAGSVSENEARKLAQQQLDSERQEKRVWGLQLSAALNGDKRADEPKNDGRLDAVRALVRERDELRAHVEWLRNEISKISDLRYIECNEPLDDALDIADAAMAKTPTQSLTEIRAEAVESVAFSFPDTKRPAQIIQFKEALMLQAAAIRQEAE